MNMRILILITSSTLDQLIILLNGFTPLFLAITSIIITTPYAQALGILFQ